MTLKEIGETTTETSKSKGFGLTEVDIPRTLCLIHSEVSEALEADRSHMYGDEENDDIRLLSDDEFKKAYEEVEKGNFEDELADIIIRTCGLAYRLGINLDYFIQVKLRYNKLRPHKHGGKKY